MCDSVNFLCRSGIVNLDVSSDKTLPPLSNMNFILLFVLCLLCASKLNKFDAHKSQDNTFGPTQIGCVQALSDKTAQSQLMLASRAQAITRAFSILMFYYRGIIVIGE